MYTLYTYLYVSTAVSAQSELKGSRPSFIAIHIAIACRGAMQAAVDQPAHISIGTRKAFQRGYQYEHALYEEHQQEHQIGVGWLVGWLVG